jgi:hypothetical protein
MSRSSAEWEFGRRIEDVVQTYYETHGWFVIPTRLIEMGGAPRAVRLLKAHVLPDLQVARSGHVRWVEVKGKVRFVWYQKAKAFRTGIAERLWHDYRRIEEETGIPGYLAMVHLRRVPDGRLNPLLLLAAFATLAPPDQDNVVKDVYEGQPMVFWDIDRFDRYELPRHDLTALPSLEPRTIHPWEKKRTLGPPQRRGPVA